MIQSPEHIDDDRRYIRSGGGSSIIPARRYFNGHRGPSTIDHVLGTDYSADVFNKSSYMAEKGALAEITEGLIVRSGLWSVETARIMVASGLEVSDPQNTSWIGFRKTAAPRGQYDGVAWQEETPMPLPKRDRHNLYMKLRAFAPEIQGKHFGRFAMQLAFNSHPEVDSISHRTGNPIAVRSWLESEVFKPGRRFPYDLPFNADQDMPLMLLWLYDRYHTQGEIPDISTGVSVGDYLEPNGAIPKKIHGETQNIMNWLIFELKFNFNRCDALYEIGELK